MDKAQAVSKGHVKKAVFHLKRDVSTKDSTLGMMVTPDDKIFGWTLEDEIRPEGQKVMHETAIPATKGDDTYQLGLHFSQKYKEVVTIFTRRQGEMHYLEYGGITFTQVYIHGGNNDDHTSGCVLIAKNRNIQAETIQGSLKAEFYAEVKKWKDLGFDTRLKVSNP